MGKLIICNGKQAFIPYYIKITNTKVYSIEELCYYIYNNVELLSDDLFGEPLIGWLEDELDLKERAAKLRDILHNSGDLRELAVCILCSCDYYTELEIKQFIHKLDELIKLSPYEKRKRKADNYLKYKQFAEAANAYERILGGEDMAYLSSEEYGNILHNLAIIKLHMVGMKEAAEGFKEAYERNHNEETLREYLIVLKLSKQEHLLMDEAKSYGVSEDKLKEILSGIATAQEQAKQTAQYKIMEELEDCKQNGRINQMYRIAYDLINEWKQEFRIENS